MPHEVKEFLKREDVKLCPKCGNTKLFIVEWYVRITDHFERVKGKDGKMIERETKFDVKRENIMLICRKCKTIIKRDPVTSKGGEKSCPV